ncbi:MAG: efflux RND transporter periplasmic adaptor subunit [Parvibaculaceae bacterium]
MGVLKQAVSIVVVVVAAAGAYAAYDQLSATRTTDTARAEQARQPVRVETAPAAERRMESRVEAVGSSLARQSIEVVALASGRVEAIEFEPGDKVKAGEVLIRLDDDIERADMAQAEGAVKENDLALKRATTLRKTNTVAQASLDTLLAQKATVTAALDRAKRRLADRNVRAPFDGIVGMRRVDVGARVDDSTVLTTLDDLSEIRVEFSLPETFFGRVSIGQPVTATTAAYGARRFEGKVASIDSRVDAAGRSFKVRATIPNADLALPAGMFMQVSLQLENRLTVAVPEEAVVPQAGKSYLFVIADGAAKRREVVLGMREPGAVEVVDGVKAGDMVVTGGLQRLRDGSAVQVVKEVGAAQ